MIAFLGIMLFIWIALGQKRYRKWAGRGHWGYAGIVGVLTLLLVTQWGIAGDPHVGNRTAFILEGVVTYIVLVTAVVAHGVVAARRRSR